jgi:hypothetical protein
MHHPEPMRVAMRNDRQVSLACSHLYAARRIDDEYKH